MILGEAIQQFRGFRYMIEQLNICSSLGRRYLYEMCWMDTMEQVEVEFSRMVRIKEFREQQEGKIRLENIKCRLMQLRDIRGTVKKVGENGLLDDLELFELKHFSLLVEEIKKMTEDCSFIRLPDLSSLVLLLDPEETQIPHFYIYDAYSVELAALRAEMKKKKREGIEEKEIERLYFQSIELEEQVREELSVKIGIYYNVLQQALDLAAWLDVVIAKVEQAESLKLCRPCLSSGKMLFCGLFNPLLQVTLRQTGKEFQALDVELLPQATLIRGANMAGKTILLKSVALAQCLVQFGFFVPALKAEMVLFDGILTSIGDEQDEMNGLSSFAAEMLRINKMVEQIKMGRKVLVLIDELARTTNPQEGRAIVNGVVDFLTENKIRALVTTHYSGIVANCRKLKVKGFVEGKREEKVNLKNLNDYIDYSLEEEQGDEVPREAMRIATLLGVDDGLLKKIRTYVQ